MGAVSVEIDLLDGFAVRVDGTRVQDAAWARRDAAAVVKVLALTEGRRLHREQLIERLWPGSSATASRRSIARRA